MKASPKHLAVSLLLFGCAAAAQIPGVATVQAVKAVPDGTDVRVEITLSHAVTPSVDTAFQPDRILLDFPDTSATANTPVVSVNQNGVRRVRTGQHSTSPMVTRVVLDLDQAHPYTVKTEGNRVILTVGPAENAGKVLHGAPVAATSGNLIGVFRRRHDETLPAPPDNTASAPLPTPPPTTGPQFEPPASSSTASTLPAPPPAVAPGPVPSVPSSNPAPPPVVQSAPAPATAAVANANANTANKPAPSVSAPTPSSVPAVSATEVAAASKGSEPPAIQPAAEPAEPVAVASSPAVIAPAAAPAPESATVTSAPSVPVAAPPPAKSEEAAAVTPEAPTNAADASGAAPKGEETAWAKPAAGTAPTTTASPEAAIIARSDDPSLHTVFKVKYVAEGVAYLDGGRTQGLSEGMKLEIKDDNTTARQGESLNSADPKIVAELEVTAVADTSAVTEIHTPKRAVKVGDVAYLSGNDAESLVQQRVLSPTRQYPAVISFTEGDTLDEEVREEVPRPPLPSVNRARGRIGIDTIETVSHGTSTVTSTDAGVVFRGDITRIGGTYWNLSGYWRGQLTRESALAAQTLQETINRTYHLNMTYDNPNSILVAGFGRLYLPWAPSLDTIDGGYFGVRASKGTTLGIFGGSTPDPSSWDYSPDNAIAGTFINFEGGDYSAFHYSATTGVGLSMIHWAANDPFIFFEDSISYKRTFAIYESAQLDSPKGTPATPAPGPGLGRNFFTFRVNPHPRLELDFNYNYFREVPTFDPTLIGTGLLDKYLFEGFTAGGRFEVFNQVWVSTQLGKSDRTGDASSSLNEMYGLTFGRIPWANVRADVRYSRFNSSFGTGDYDALSLSRQMSERLRLELLLGQQNFASPITTNTRSKFITGTVETTLGPHYYLQGNFTTNRGDMNYDQFMFSAGYRFDSKRRSQ